MKPVWTVGAVAGAVIATAAFYEAAATLGVDLPRPAWKGEVTELAAVVLPDVRAKAVQELLQVQGTIAHFRRSREPVPTWLIKREQELKEQIETIDRIRRK